MIIRELGRNPIHTTNPTGDDIRYDPLFDTLQSEIDAKPSAGSSGTSWGKVVEVASNILETKSKDILVACYLAVGLLHVEGVPHGLLNGATLLKEMIESFWDTMYPPVKRMRGRTQAIGWWVERTENCLEKIDETAEISAVVAEELISTVEALYDLVSEQCPEAPSLRRILEFARAIPVEAPEKPEAPQDVPESPPPASPSSVSTEKLQPADIPRQQPQSNGGPVFSQSTLATQDDANRLLASIVENNYLLVDFMLDLPTAEPSWYRLNFFTAWFEIRRTPPASDSRTLIPPPDRQIMNSLAAMKGAENWGGVVKSASYTIRRYPFWLDMNRFVAEALSMMGEQYHQARKAVEEESARFVMRIPGIEDFTFSDGTPFADGQTKGWLRSLDGGGSAQQGITVSGDDLAAKVSEEFSNCRELLNSGKQGEGLSLMQNHLQSSRSGRERYLWRLSLVQLLTISGMEKLAVPHISELMKDYDAFRLEEWDPDMALHALKTVWNVLRTLNDTESKRKADDIMARISMLSPSDAFNLSK